MQTRVIPEAVRGSRKAACIVAAITAAALALGLVTTSPASSLHAVAGPDVREAVFVGNNWDGTADVIDPRTYERVARINIIPDIDERMMEIVTDPVRLAYFLAIRHPTRPGVALARFVGFWSQRRTSSPATRTARKTSS